MAHLLAAAVEVGGLPSCSVSAEVSRLGGQVLVVGRKDGEELARAAGLVAESADLFLVGMLSLLDALVARPIPALTPEMAIPPRICDCLLDDNSPPGPIRRLAQAANLIAEGRRDIAVDTRSSDEIGRLAGAFNAMTESLVENESELERRAAESTALYEIGQEISAQVDLQPTLDQIVERQEPPG